MSDLGITQAMSQADYLAAMQDLPSKDPATRALLAAIKATGKGGIGKLRAGPHELGHLPYEPWPALNTPTWRPDIRAAIISRTRVNLHRKAARMADETGHYPLAALSDCLVYPATRPSALDVVPTDSSGHGVAGCFHLGVNPGYSKEEGVRSMDWYLQHYDDGLNPARHIKHSHETE